MKMFSKIAPFFSKLVYLKLNCDLISQVIFKLFQQIEDYFRAIPMVTINICFYTEKLNFKTGGVNFLPLPKSVKLSKSK